MESMFNSAFVIALSMFIGFIAVSVDLWQSVFGARFMIISFGVDLR
jgi:hypothetical protein